MLRALVNFQNVLSSGLRTVRSWLKNMIVVKTLTLSTYLLFLIIVCFPRRHKFVHKEIPLDKYNYDVYLMKKPKETTPFTGKVFLDSGKLNMNGNFRHAGVLIETIQQKTIVRSNPYNKIPDTDTLLRYEKYWPDAIFNFNIHELKGINFTNPKLSVFFRRIKPLFNRQEWTFDVRELNFSQSNFDNVTFSTGTSDVFLSDCKISNSTFNDSLSAKYHSTLVYDCTLSGARFGSTSLSLMNVQIDSNSVVEGFDTLYLDKLKGSGILNLENPGNSENGAHVFLDDVNLSHLNLPDNGIFYHANSYSISDRIKIYKQLASRFENSVEKKQLYEITALKLEYLREDDWWSPILRENWNNFGYNKNLILRNSLFLYILFILLNWLTYPKLLYKGYNIPEFERVDRLIKRKLKKGRLYEIRNFLHCVIYTFFVFWGLNLNLDNLKLGNIRYAFLILCQYLIGIICLGYIANLVIDK